MASPRPARRRRHGSEVRSRLETLEDRRLLSISEFSLPLNEGYATTEIATGSDGNLWFGFEDYGGYIGTINPATDVATEYPVTGFADGVGAGSDGNVWFCGAAPLGDYVGMINPSTHASSEFILPAGTTGDGPPEVITAGPDGNMWFTNPDSNAVGMINPTTHAITEFTLPTASANPDGITTGPDGNLWFREARAGKVGSINPTTHAITEFSLPTVGTWPFAGITTGPDGNLWFTDSGTNSIGTINPTTHAIAEFAVPTPSARLFRITAAGGNLWFTEAAAGQLGEINPTTHAITEFGIPAASAYPFGITTGPDGNVWFTDPASNGVGVDTLSTSSLVVTQQPPGTVTAGSGFGFTVTAEDSAGNPITTFNGTVTVTLGANPGGSTLGGTLMATATNGVATFSGLTLNKAASGYHVFASGGGYALGVTAPITVVPAAATQVVITQQPPATVKVKSSFGLQASIEDAYGNVETTATSTVTVALANNPGGATLGGKLSLSATQGVVTFSGLTISKTGSGYTLRLSSAGLASAVTSSFNVSNSGKSTTISTRSVKNATETALAPQESSRANVAENVRIVKVGKARHRHHHHVSHPTVAYSGTSDRKH